MSVDTNLQYTKSEMDELLKTGKSAAYDARISDYRDSGGKVGTIRPTDIANGVIDLNKAPIDKSGIDNLISLTSPISASTKQLTDDIDKAQQSALSEYQKTYNESKAQKASWMDKLSGAITNTEKALANQRSTEDIFGEVLEKYGITSETFKTIQSKQAELENYNKQLIDLDAKEQAALDKSSQNLASMDFIRGEKALVERQFASKKAAVAAKAGVVASSISALQGDIETARSLAKDVVSMVTYDQEQKVNSLKWAQETYADLFSMMDQEESNAWKSIYDMQTTELATRKDDISKIMSLVVQYPSSGWPTDLSKITLEEATQIASKANAKQIALENSLAQQRADTSSVGSAKDLARQEQIDQLISDKKTSYREANPNSYDNMISANDYLELRKKWVGLGGTLADFVASYPAEMLLTGKEMENLPTSLRPATVAPEGKLNSQQQGWINEAKADLDYVKQMYGDTVAMRNALIERYKQQYGFDISAYLD